MLRLVWNRQPIEHLFLIQAERQGGTRRGRQAEALARRGGVRPHVKMFSRPRTFTAFVFVLALALSPSRARAGEPLPDLVSHVKRAVVIVNSFDGRGRLLAQGSGFFVGRERIVTNLHVVGTATRVEVKTFGGQTFAVEGVRAFDAKRDLALLEASVPATSEIAMLELAAASPRPGEEIFVVSNPRGAAWQVTSGLALAAWEFQELGAMLPFTAAVSRGSSGGPVVNLQGRVVGIATMSLRRAEEFHLAVPGECAAALRPEALLAFPLSSAE